MSLQKLVSAGHAPDSIWRMTVRQFNAWLEAADKHEQERMAIWFPLLVTAAQGSSDSIKKIMGELNGSNR